MGQFNPMTEDEAKLAGLLKPGECDYEVFKAEDRTSKAGNDYLNVGLKVWDADGRQQTVWDILMYKGQMAHRLRHFLYSCGMGRNYESGTLSPSDLLGKGGRVKIRNGTDRETGEGKNVVADYVVADTTKDQPGYQKAKTAQQASASTAGATMLEAELKAAKMAAWGKFSGAFAKDFPQATTDEVNAAWKTALTAYWPGKRIPDDITAHQWRQIVEDGFKRPASPISDKPEFDESSIPF